MELSRCFVEKPVEPGELLDALKKSILQVEEEYRSQSLTETQSLLCVSVNKACFIIHAKLALRFCE